MPRRYRPVAGMCRTSPPSTSVASSRDTVLTFRPVRRAISLVPSSPWASPSTFSTAMARCTDSTCRAAGFPVLATAELLPSQPALASHWPFC